MSQKDEETRDSVSSARPGGSQPEAEPRRSEELLSSNRSDLILVLGALSLFLCGPLGILAWIMAQADLRKIRQGRISAAKIRTIKVGRVLAITGTALFCITLALGAVIITKGIHPFELQFGSWTDPRPLPIHQIVFVGEWYGSKGTLIRIRPDGSGDFRTRRTSMTGGHVTIDENFISIGFLGFSRTWKVAGKPELRDGHWSMRLDDEVFLKKTDDLYVQGASPCTSEQSAVSRAMS